MVAEGRPDHEGNGDGDDGIGADGPGGVEGTGGGDERNVSAGGGGAGGNGDGGNGDGRNEAGGNDAGGDAGDPHEEPARPSVDAICELVADRRRRRVLYRLVDASEPVPVDDLVEDLAEAEGALPDDPTAENPRRLRTALHHSHLPKLAEAGVVSLEKDGEAVRFRGDPLVEDLLEHTRRYDER